MRLLAFSVTGWRRVTVALALASSVFTVAGSTSAGALGTVAVGNDVSFPQCAVTLPTGSAFGVVGVTNGTLYTVNPCLSQEITWAASTASPVPSFYVTGADLGPSSTHWPTGQSTPVACDGTDSAACAYDYGWNGALAAVTAVTTASSAAVASAGTWWLDIETGESWEGLQSPSTPSGLANDLASIDGMIGALGQRGVRSVGLYSSLTQWNEIVGAATVSLPGVTTPSLSTLPEWLPGFSSTLDAQAGCAAAPFAGGVVTMTQFVTGSVDSDLACALTPSPQTVSAAQTSPGAVSVSWAAPAQSALHYVVTTNPSSGGCETDATSCQITGLRGGVTYQFSVTASSATAAVSPAVTTSVAVTSLPGAPRLSMVLASGVESIVSVSEPQTGGLKITSYQYQIGSGSWRPAGLRQGRLTLFHLRAGATVRLRVRAKNALGTSPASAPLLLHISF